MAPARDLAALQLDLEHARALFQRGRPRQSLRRLLVVRRHVESAQVGPAPALLARVVLSQACAQYEVSADLPGCLGLLDTAEALAAEAGHEGILASVRGQRGLLLLRSGRTAQALAALDDAEAVCDQAEPRDRALILLNRGALHLERGDLRAATTDLERCLQVAGAAGDGERYWAAWHNLGYVDFLAGRLPRALARMEEALAAEADDPHPVNLLDKARVLREAGLVGDADAILAQAAELFAHGGLAQDLGETELVRAECALLAGDPGRARELARSALRRFIRRGNQTWQRQAELMVLRCDRMADGSSVDGRVRHRLRRLASAADDLARRCRAEGRDDLARSAQLLADEARLSAGDTAGHAPPRVRASDPLGVRLAVRQVRALTARSTGDRTAATREVRRAFAELTAHQHQLGSLDLRTAAAVHGVALARLRLDLAMETGRPAAVFDAIEDVRAVSTRLPQVRPPNDDETAELLTELRQVEEAARALVGEAGAAATVAQLRGRAGQLQRAIRARAWELEARAGSPHASARLAQVRDALAGRPFACYARHRGRWVAVLAAGSGVQLRDLADVVEVDALVRRVRADLDALAMPRLPDLVADAVQHSLEVTLRRLDELLVVPLGVEGRPLVVSVSGSLVVLPWSLLPSRAGLPVVVAPSATVWLRNQDRPRARRPRLVAVAGPGLRRSDDEAEQVAGSWPRGRLLRGSDATVDAVKQALGNADVVHIAAHGTHRQDSPLFSSIRLDDGQLYAYELDAEQRIAPLVVLSSCEAGLATVRPGDEGLGLTNVLLQLGVRSVLAAIARVADQDAADLMDRVHHGMAGGIDSAEALASAQAAIRTLRGPGSRRIARPVPFLCFGSTW